MDRFAVVVQNVLNGEALIAPDGLTSDPLSTALTLLGEQERRQLLDAYPGTKAYVRVLRNEE